MKKIVLLIVTAFALGFSARAQFTVGGNVSFHHKAGEKQTSFNFSPDMGYELGDFFVGTVLRYEWSGDRNEGSWKRNVGISPYVDYSFWSVKPLTAFVEAGCDITAVSSSGEQTLLNWAPYLALGFEVDITDHWYVEIIASTLKYSDLYREWNFSVLGSGFSAGLYYVF